MQNTHNTFRFFYNSPIAGLTQCYPSNDTIEFAWEKQGYFYRKKVASPLKFTGADFEALYAIDRSDMRCDKIDFTIEIQCGDGYFPFYTGFLPLVKGNFKVSKCIVEILPTVEDKYACLLANWDKEKDIIGVTNKIDNIKITGLGEIEVFYCHTFEEIFSDPFDWGDECLISLLPPESWGIAYQTSETTNVPNSLAVTTIFGREIQNSETDPGPPWVLLGPGPGTTSRYGRPLTLGELIVDEDGNLIDNLNSGYRLMEIIQWLLEPCGLTLRSDFYGFNPTGLAPSNFAYDYAAAYLSDLLLFQITDVKDPNADQAASKGLSKLKDILEHLGFLHNAGWTIDGTDFILEHQSYFEQGRNMLDLTQPATVEFIAGKHEYRYLTESMPRSEKWSYPVITEDVDFDGVPIEYSETCSYDEDGKDQQYKMSIWVADILHIITYPTRYGNDLFVIAAYDADLGSIIKMPGEISGAGKINGPLALSNTIYYLQRHGRPQKTGQMNFQPEQFFNVQKKRAQPELTIPICCEDLLQFDPADYVKSQLGWGAVANAKYDSKNKFLSLELNFD